MSSNEMVGTVAISTERLRQRLQQEGLSEEAIADSEMIMRDFEALQKQPLLSETPQDLGNMGVTTQVMEASFTFKTSLNEWRNYLCDINFWLDGYLHTTAYRDLEPRFISHENVQWNVGVGATACFARAISSIARDVIIRYWGPYDPVIEVDMKHEAVLGTSRLLGINGELAIKVAEQLGLLDHHEYYRSLKADQEELWYYTYGLRNATVSLESLARSSLASQIMQKLITKRYLLVVENLDEPINRDAFTEGLSFLPPPRWKNSRCLISTTSQDVYNRSKAPNDWPLKPSWGEDMVILTLYSLHQAAKYILGAIGGHKDDEQHWHHMAVRCFHYATMLLASHCHSSSSHHGVDGGQQSSVAGLAHITSDELIRHWAAQGILAAATGSEDIYRIGNVILEAFQEYSLLPHLPFSLSPATTEDTKSAAHFLACHNLIADHHTADELWDGDHPRLEHMKWILHVGNGDQGWHLSREWLSDGASGPTTLILRHCSQQSRLLAMLDHLLAKLPCLLLLDLSYSSVESVPPSIFCLQKLKFLSLRGCYNMASPFSFFLDTDMTTPLPENNSNTEIISSLLHLDLSYSNVKRFHCDFFCWMPNLQELLLLKCSNLEELPPSTAALSSLEKLELRGTQIKSFPGKMFEDMKKLRSVKIIDNKKLFFAPTGLFSRASGGLLTDVHIERCESITEDEVALEKHPTLRSFSFIGAPHMKRLSLRGCRKLEYVDIKEVGALEELDLSATAIKELPDNIPNLPQLRRLLLMGVPSLRRFPWHKLERFPDLFCLNQCSYSTINHSDPPQVAQVCISDSRLFHSFNHATQDLVKDGKILKTFYVQVTSCKPTTRKMQDGEDVVMTNNTLEVVPAAYADVNHRYLTDRVSVVSMDDVPPFRKTERHVEISAADRYPHGLMNLLAVTKSISMWDDTNVSYQLPSLRRIRLLELPLLEHLHVDNPILTAPAWEELHVRGCWSLRRLPRLSPQQPADKKKAAVKVSGEREWWDKLRWDQDHDDDALLHHRDSYEPMLPPAFASHRERVVIESYLR